MPKRYIVALVIIAAVFFLGVWLLISLITGIGSNESSNQQPDTPVKVSDFSKDTEQVAYTVYGAVVGEEDRRAIKIIVSSNERRVEVLEGYYETVGKSQTTPNNQSAFDALLLALEGAGFNRYDSRNNINEYTVCTIGQRFVYETKLPDNETIRSWSNSCGRKQGSFQGDARLVQTLMQAQIPGYSEFVSGVEL